MGGGVSALDPSVLHGFMTMHGPQAAHNQSGGQAARQPGRQRQERPPRTRGLSGALKPEVALMPLLPLLLSVLLGWMKRQRVP